MGTLAQNLRYAIRTLRNNPGFALVVVLTLALGIGANTAIFSVVYSALLRPLPYREPGKLYHFEESRIQNDNSTNGAQASYPDYLDWKRTAKSVQSFAGYSGDAFTLSANGEPKNTFALQVTPNFFSTLGVRPALGRDFLENEMQVEDDPHVAILTDAFWRTELGADPNILVRVIHLNDKPVTIVGVLPREFTPDAFHRAAQGICRAFGSWSEPRQPAFAIADGKPVALVYRRWSWTPRGTMGSAFAGGGDTGISVASNALSAERGDQLSSPCVSLRSRVGDGDSLRAGARAGSFAYFSE